MRKNTRIYTREDCDVFKINEYFNIATAGSGTINLKASSALYHEVPVSGCCVCSPVSEEHAEL